MTVRSCAVIGFAMAVAILSCGPYTNYSPPAVDMWFSTGYFTNFSDMVDRFGLEFYQVSRLPYILPGVAIYAVFTPKVANFVLNLASFGTTVTALLVIASRRLDARWSVALTSLFALNSYLLYANLWDYSDGPAIAYFLVGLATLSVMQARRMLGVPALLGIGACWSLAALTNLLAAVLVLPFTIYAVLIGGFSWREAIRRAAWLVGGAILAFLPLAIFSQLNFGFWFFPAPQFAQLLYVAKSPDFLPNMWGTGYGWIATDYRLGALYGPMLAAVPCLFSQKVRTRDFSATFAVCAAGGLLYLVAELCDKVILRAPYHGTFLLIFAFFQTIALVQAGAAAATSPADRLLGPRVLAVLAMVIALSFIRVRDLNVVTWPVLGLSVVSLAATIAIPRRIPRRAAFMSASIAILLNVATASDGYVRWIYDSHKNIYNAAIQTQALLTSGILKGEKIRFWHDRDDPQSAIFTAVNALYLWRYVDLSKQLPTLSEQDAGWVLPPGIVLVHLCTGTCPLDVRAKLLRAAHIEVISTFTWQIRPEEGDPFAVAIQKTRPLRDEAPYNSASFDERPR